MSGKPVAEQEIGLLIARSGYAETSMSRRKFYYYFGEEFDGENGEGADMDDNVKKSKTKSKHKIRLYTIKVVRDTRHLYKSKEIVFFFYLRGNAVIKHIEQMFNLFLVVVWTMMKKYWMAMRQVLFQVSCLKILKLQDR
jgi:ATP-dependent DNA helicase RecQ